jgi:hypothetical protein
MPEKKPAVVDERGRFVSLGQYVAVVGFVLFAAFVPHSIAGAEISLAIAGVGWLIRSVASRGAGVHRTRLDLPIGLFLLWTVASALLSAEPRISIGKLQSVMVLLVFYATQAIVTRRTAVILVAVMIFSGVVGTLGSIYDLARGRGVIVNSISADSPFRQIQTGAVLPGSAAQPTTVQLEKGDTVWRIAGRAVYSLADIDQIIREARPGERLSVSVITHGEHAEWAGFAPSELNRQQQSPSGLTGAGRLHRFRASGWTRHYEYFAEILQILALLALGLALANYQNHRANRRFKLAIMASGLLAFGVAFTAMRSVLFAFAIGGSVVVWRAAKGAGAKLLVTAAIAFVVGFGAVVIWQTRATSALSLHDYSASLRLQLARVGLRRVLVHPLFGHGMDAVKQHWVEWGFPGNVIIHLHSTPLQLAFDRGLPALCFWFWIMLTFWLIAKRGEQATSDSGDTNRHGVLLGATGALTAFLVSSLVNYNFGAGVVALVFWWLMGTVVVLARTAED